MKEKSVPQNNLAIFQGKTIRKLMHNKEWYFSVTDVVHALTDSVNARDYWSKMKIREEKESTIQLSTICLQLKLKSSDGKNYATDCANTEGIFRIIQSIPSPKAEPFKLWFAKLAQERVQEIADPELATKRTRELYKAKGYSDDWIEKRMRGIAIREELTGEWGNRGAQNEKDYAILTAEISKATFGMTPSEYKNHKGLKRENLRDHMNDLELIFNMLGEAATTEITRTRDAKGIPEMSDSAKSGGQVAGNARIELESKTGKKVVTKDNYLSITQKVSKRQKKL
ncbi:MAG: Bro-N domain-containing protein [Fibrobacteres bacterium]|nr:Bro-N domain-containing protein [Fibrobacterota bacterium]